MYCLVFSSINCTVHLYGYSLMKA